MIPLIGDAVTHAAEADAGNFEAGTAKLHVLHHSISHRSSSKGHGCMIRPHGLDGMRPRNSGSQEIRRWRKPDSNPRFPGLANESLRS
jgi:hypothetical protein